MSRSILLGASCIGAMIAACGLAAPAAAQTIRAEATKELARGLGGLDLTRKASDHAVRRYAIVVGNQAYENIAGLVNAVGDAKAVAAFLRDHDFIVFEDYDVDKRRFERLLRRALLEFDANSEVLFYFAGHGIQIGRRNYLLPTDVMLESAYDVPFETMTLDQILALLSSRSRLQLVVLDSCRDNPFTSLKLNAGLDAELYETGAGFSTMTAPINTLLSFSTSPGALAEDGEAGGHSPFTAAFVGSARAAPGESITRILETVRREVYEATDGRQVPWESSTLVEPFLFDRAPAAAPRVAEAPPAALEKTAELSLTASLDRELDIGALISEVFPAPAGARISISAPPREGALVFASADPADVASTAGGALSALSYDVSFEERNAALSGDYSVTDTFELAVDVDGEVTPIRVSLTSEADPCDAEAGDWLDPGGVGLARYPNQIEPEKALAACETAVARSPEVGRFHYQLGRALQALRRYDEAEAAFAAARDRGHVRGWYALGELLASRAIATGGGADERAPDEALAHFAAGVELGDAYAMHALGKQLLRYGRDKAEREEGFDLLGRAIEIGHTFSMNELGYYFLERGSDHYQPERGLEYLKASAEREDIFGYNNLGLVRAQGLDGTAPDPAAALDWFVKAANGGHPYAPVNIGRMYFRGELGAEPDLEAAIEWYDKGLARGDAWGGANAAWIILNRKAPNLGPVDAAIRAAKSAALRNEEAAKEARALLSGFGERDMTLAAQTMLNELGAGVTVDGLWGGESRDAILALVEKSGLEADLSSPTARLMTTARLFWRSNPFRVDLY